MEILCGAIQLNGKPGAKFIVVVTAPIKCLCAGFPLSFFPGSGQSGKMLYCLADQPPAPVSSMLILTD